MITDDLMRKHFNIPRTPRSPAYQHGARDYIDFYYHGNELKSHWRDGTPENDAFWAGVEEGKQICKLNNEAAAKASIST